jgi:hypothetical protein
MDVDFYLGERRFPALLGEESMRAEKSDVVLFGLSCYHVLLLQ